MTKSIICLLSMAILLAAARPAAACGTPPCQITGAVTCSIQSVTVKRDPLNPFIACLDFALTNSTTPAGCGGAFQALTFSAVNFGASILPGGTIVSSNIPSPIIIPPGSTIIGKLTLTFPAGTPAGIYKIQVDINSSVPSPIMLPTSSSCCGTICISDNLTAEALIPAGTSFPSALSCALPGAIQQKGFRITNCDPVNPRALTFSLNSRQTSSIAPVGSGDNFPLAACGIVPVGNTMTAPVVMNGTLNLAPGEVRTVCFWTSSFPACQPGSNCQFLIEIRDAATLQIVGCAESALTVVNPNWNWGQSIPSTVGPTLAGLQINNQTPSVVAPGVHVVPMPSGDLTISVSGGGAQRPFILASGTLSFGAFPVPLGGGALDLANPQVLLDGIFLTAGPFDSNARTNFSVTITVAPPCSGYSSPGFQAIFFDPTAVPFPFGLTEAGAAAQPPIGTVFTTVGPNVDDGFINVPINCGPVRFYGQQYSGMAVCSNGRIMFGPTGNTDLSESVLDLTNQSPSVNIFWDDLLPTAAASPGGSITTVDSASNLSVIFSQIRRFTAANGFVNGALNINKATGEITIAFGAVGTAGLLTGIGPGNNLVPMAPPELNMNMTVAFLALQPLHPIYELFTAPNPVADTFDLQGQSMRYTPTNGPGNGPYLFQRP